MLARMPDSGKLKPPTVTVPLFVLVAGEPPPDDPQALAIRLSPRIEDIRARKAHVRIAFPPGRAPASASGIALISSREQSVPAHGNSILTVRERCRERPF